MKDKNIAGILALFVGAFGIHHFYLGRKARGIFYILLSWTMVSWIMAFVDALILFSMDKSTFDEKYNKKYLKPREEQLIRPSRTNSGKAQSTAKKSGVSRAFRDSGMAKFKDYDYQGAIEDFKKHLEADPGDIATHFNLACGYSLMENTALALSHLDQAVSFGFKDFQKIKEHHALAFLRTQKEFEAFQQNGYRLSRQAEVKTEAEENILSTQPDLLEQLKKLGDLRAKGLLTEREFEEQKKKLLK